MNKSKKPMTVQLRKKMKKELRSAASMPESIPKSDRITPKDLLSRFPAKAKKGESTILKSLEKKFEARKNHKKQSKRTTPGTVDQKSPPQIVHIEGRRWIKTVTKQSVAKRKVMNRQMAKKGSK
jgi:hypothetical protein